MTANRPERKAGPPAKGPRAAAARAAAAAADIPDDPQELVEDIKQTREQVGQTVEALTNKLDPKVQLRETTERMKGRVSATTGQVTSKITDTTGTVGQQLRGTAAKAARSADEQRVQLAVVGGVAVVLSGAWTYWVMRRR
jgi:methyl-accepting chemotaxis protein